MAKLEPEDIVKAEAKKYEDKSHETNMEQIGAGIKALVTHFPFLKDTSRALERHNIQLTIALKYFVINELARKRLNEQQCPDDVLKLDKSIIPKHDEDV